MDIISDTRALLLSLVDHTLVRSRRRLFESDFRTLPTDTRDQLSDGPLELEVDDGRIVSFVPETKRATVLVIPTPMPVWGPSYKLHELSQNDFWLPRLHRQVTGVGLLFDEGSELTFDEPFGISFGLEGLVGFVVEYISNDQFSDQLRVLSHAEGRFEMLSLT